MHLHLDVDVLHPCVAPANSYAVVNGISKEELFETIELIFEHPPPASLTIASYDPAFDKENKMRSTIYELIKLVAKFKQLG
jgi:arginase